MKKLSLVLATAGLTASLGAFAAIPTDAAPFQLVVPNLKPGLDITLEGLWLKPTSSDFDYASTAFTTTGQNNAGDLITTTGSGSFHSVDPDYEFGFRVGLGYTFPESGNDVQLSWTHFGNSDDDGFNLGVGSVIQSRLLDDSFQATLPNASTVLVSAANASVDNTLDSVDLDVGQYMDVGTRLRMRLFAGLRFARVSSDLSTDFIVLENSGGTTPLVTEETRWNEEFNSKFTGVGPRFGVDSVYHLGYCFGLAARASAALLFGETQSDSKLSWNEIDRSDGTTISNFHRTIDSDDSDRVVPVLDGKLGLNYTYTFENQSLLTIELGYQAVQYIDAIERLDASIDTSVGSTSPADVSVPVRRTTSGIGFSGPYLSLNWKV